MRSPRRYRHESLPFLVRELKRDNCATLSRYRPAILFSYETLSPRYRYPREPYRCWNTDTTNPKTTPGNNVTDDFPRSINFEWKMETMTQG